MQTISDLPAVQQALRALEGVAYAQVRWPDPQGPAFLRIEFAPGADEQAVTREVMQTLRTVGGVDLDTMEVRLPDDAAAERPVFVGLTVEREELDTTVEVTLRWKGREATGRAEGVASHQSTPRTAAAATLVALRSFLPAGVRVQVDWLEVTEPALERPGTVHVAVTCLTRHEEELLLGSALVRGDVREAAVRATLDALNRRVARLA